MPTARPVIEIDTTGPEAVRRLLQLVRYGAQNTDRAVASRDAAIRGPTAPVPPFATSPTSRACHT